MRFIIFQSYSKQNPFEASVTPVLFFARCVRRPAALAEL